MTTAVFSRKQIVANITTLLSGVMLARGISALTLILTARYLGPDIFGQYATSLALTRILAVLFTLGLDTWLLRSGGKNLKLIRNMSTACLIIELSLGVLWIIGLILIGPYLNQDAFPAMFVILLGCSVFFEELGNLFASSFKAALKNSYTMVMLASGQFLLLLFTLILIIQGSNNPLNFLVARVMAMSVAAFIFFLIFLRIFGLRYKISDIRQALRETKSFAASVLLGNLSRQIDVVIVASFAGKTAAGLYAPAITIVSTLFIIPAATYDVMFPVLSSTYQKNVQAVKQVARRLLILSIVVGSLMALITIFMAKPLTQVIFGAEYTTTGDILRIFSIILLFRFISSAAAAVLAAVRWQRYRVMVQAAVVIISITLNLLVVTTWGIFGVASVYVFAEALLMLGYSSFAFVWFRKYQEQQPKPVPNNQ